VSSCSIEHTKIIFGRVFGELELKFERHGLRAELRTVSIHAMKIAIYFYVDLRLICRCMTLAAAAESKSLQVAINSATKHSAALPVVFVSCLPSA
jgi:hypothetical protein